MAAQVKQLAAEVQRLSKIVQENKRLSLATSEVQQSLSKRWRRDDTSYQRPRPMEQSAYFPGNCRNCGRWGHKAVHCRRASNYPSAGQPFSGRTPSTGPPSARPPLTGGNQETLANTTRPGVNAVQAKNDNPFAEFGRSDLPTYPVRIEGAPPVTCLFDTGAKVSLMSGDFVRQLSVQMEEAGEELRLRAAPTLALYAADGNALTIAGCVEVTMRVGEMSTQQLFVVTDGLIFSVLLGCDFMWRTGADISFKGGTVTLTDAQGKAHTAPLFSAFSTEPETESVNKGQTVGRVLAVTSLGRTPAITDGVEPDQRARGSGSNAEAWKPSEKVAISPALDERQTEQVKELIDRYSDTFSSGPHDMGRMAAVTHEIDTGDHQPVNQQPYRMAPDERDEADRQIQSMLDNGVICESKSPWASPVVMRDKKDDTKRFCCNYQALNEITKKDRYPLPRVDDCLDELAGSYYYTCLDMATGFWQIKVRERDREKTAFISPSGLFEFQVMPFGLCNAPSTFQRAMDHVLAGLKWRTCIVYVDDILVFSATFEGHLKDLAEVLERCRQHNLKLKPAKCIIASEELKYLGYVVKRGGLAVDPEKVRAVRDLAPPTNRTLLKSFLGLTSYYRRFIRAYAEATEPLYRLLRGKPETFVWATEQQEAFEKIKTALTTAPLLVHPDWTKPFKLQTDASDYAIGAVLSQEDDEARERVVSYASRQLTADERKYDTREKELLAVVWGCETHAKYLGQRPFVIETDHANLKWLMKRDPPRGRLARWVLRLQAFDMQIKHRPEIMGTPTLYHVSREWRLRPRKNPFLFSP